MKERKINFNPQREIASAALALLIVGILVMAFFLVFSCWSYVQADTMMDCGGRIVSLGDSMGDVMQRCGRPDHRFFQSTERQGSLRPRFGNRSNFDSVVIANESWFYLGTDTTFSRTLHFSGGFLVDIETGALGR